MVLPASPVTIRKFLASHAVHIPADLCHVNSLSIFLTTNIVILARIVQYVNSEFHFFVFLYIFTLQSGFFQMLFLLFSYNLIRNKISAFKRFFIPFYNLIRNIVFFFPENPASFYNLIRNKLHYVNHAVV